MATARIFALLLLLTAAPATAQLSPQAQFDMLGVELRAAIVDGNHKQTLELIRQIRATGLPAGNEVLFFEGQALARTGETGPAFQSLTRYINQAGRTGANYQNALALLGPIQADLTRQRDEFVTRIRKALAIEDYTVAAQLLASIRQGFPKDGELAALQKDMEAGQRSLPARQAERRQQLTGLEAELAQCEERSTGLRVGQITEIKADWGFAVASLTGSLSAGQPVQVKTDDGYLPAKIGKSLPDGRLSLTLPGGLTPLKIGHGLHRAYPDGTPSPCDPQKNAVRDLKQKLERAG